MLVSLKAQRKNAHRSKCAFENGDKKAAVVPLAYHSLPLICKLSLGLLLIGCNNSVCKRYEDSRNGVRISQTRIEAKLARMFGCRVGKSKGKQVAFPQMLIYHYEVIFPQYPLSVGQKVGKRPSLCKSISRLTNSVLISESTTHHGRVDSHNVKNAQPRNCRHGSCNLAPACLLGYRNDTTSTPLNAN